VDTADHKQHWLQHYAIAEDGQHWDRHWSNGGAARP
jgi:hypothetical protein